MITVYGIKNCNTVKAALDWLKKNKVALEFHDYKSKGIPEAKLKQWSKQVGWESLVNKRGTTWRQLDEATQAKVTNEAEAIALMKEKTSVIRICTEIIPKIPNRILFGLGFSFCTRL